MVKFSVTKPNARKQRIVEEVCQKKLRIVISYGDVSYLVYGFRILGEIFFDMSLGNQPQRPA